MISALFRRWSLQTPAIRTARLKLIAITPDMLAAEASGAKALRDILDVEVGVDWPPEHWESHVWAHILAQYRASPGTFGWHRYMVAESEPARLVGCLGGFPCADGDVELGYSVAESAQRQGFGSEAAGALTRWFLERPEVRSVSAQAFETAPASIRIMQHCGMRCVGEGDQPGTTRYRRWRSSSETPRV